MCGVLARRGRYPGVHSGRLSRASPGRLTRKLAARSGRLTHRRPGWPKRNIPVDVPHGPHKRRYPMLRYPLASRPATARSGRANAERPGDDPGRVMCPFVFVGTNGRACVLVAPHPAARSRRLDVKRPGGSVPPGRSLGPLDAGPYVPMRPMLAACSIPCRPLDRPCRDAREVNVCPCEEPFLDHGVRRRGNAHVMPVRPAGECE